MAGMAYKVVKEYKVCRDRRVFKVFRGVLLVNLLR